MVYDRLYGVDISKQKSQQNPDMRVPDEQARSEENILHTLSQKTPKEHRIGEKIQVIIEASEVDYYVFEYDKLIQDLMVSLFITWSLKS